MASVSETNPAPEGNAELTSGRRGFLGWVIGGILAFIGAAVGIPAIGAVVSAAAGEHAQTTINLGKVEGFPMGQPKLAQFTLTQTDGWVKTLDSRAVWVLRTSDTQATVYSGRCTHLGCSFSWQDRRAAGPAFVCPCHDGVFGLDGRVLAGPPPRPLDTLTAKIDNGILTIEFQDFRLGVADKLPG